MGKMKELAMEQELRPSFTIVVQKEGRVIEVVGGQALFNVFSFANNLGLKGEVITAIGQEPGIGRDPQITFFVE